VPAGVGLLGVPDPGVHPLGERGQHRAGQRGRLCEQRRPPRPRPEQLPGDDVPWQHVGAQQVRQRAGAKAAVDVGLPQPVLALGVPDAMEQRGQAARVEVWDAVLVPEDPHPPGLPATRRCRGRHHRAADQDTDQRDQREPRTGAWEGAAGHGTSRVGGGTTSRTTSLANIYGNAVNLPSASDTACKALEPSDAGGRRDDP
jgi:hypothetical protein